MQSEYQTAGLMLCFTLSRLPVFKAEGDSMSAAIFGELAACAILFGLSVLLCKLPRRERGGRIAAAVCAVYYTAALSLLLCETVRSTQYSFPGFYSTAPMVISLAAAAAYCASMGPEGCSRAACAAVVMTLIAFVLMIAGVAGGFDGERIEFADADRFEQFGRELWKSLSRSCELPLLVTLMRRRSKSPVKASAMYFFARAALSGTAFLICMAVLGDHSRTGQPLFSLAAYAKTALIERFDALVILFRTLCMLISAAALLTGLRICLSEIREKAERAMPLGAAVSALSALILLGADLSPLPLWSTGAGIALAAGISAARKGRGSSGI